MNRARWIVAGVAAVAFVACGGSRPEHAPLTLANMAPKAEPTVATPEPAPDSCEAVARLIDANLDRVTDKTAAAARIATLADICTDDAWSAATRSCFAGHEQEWWLCLQTLDRDQDFNYSLALNEWREAYGQ